MNKFTLVNRKKSNEKNQKNETKTIEMVFQLR